MFNSYAKIEGYRIINISDQNTQTNFENYRQILLEKNNQIDISVRIEGEENALLGYCYRPIRIIIVKS